MKSRSPRGLRFETLEPRKLLAADLMHFGQIAYPTDIEGDLISLLIPEKEQSLDLNGDGDATDVVLHLHNAATGTTENLGVAAGNTKLAGDYVVTLVREALQNATDLNGDGDVSDGVLHVYDVTNGQLTNVGLAIQSVSGVAIAGDQLIFTVPEGNNGGIDLNGDGDAIDSVLHVYDMAADTTTNLGIQASGLELDGSWLAFAVWEVGQGNTDLNADGDTSDSVVHVYDAKSRTVTNLGINRCSGSACYSVSGDHLAVSVSEHSQGRNDLNHDGDADDVVLHLVNLATMTTTNFEVAVDGFAINDHLLAFGATETGQGGTDLNGDLDTNDTVMHVHALGTGETRNLQLAGNASSKGCLFGDQLRFAVPEGKQGDNDLNGDGDTYDSVLHTFDSSAGVVNHQVAMNDRYYILSEPLVVFKFWEAGDDLNGDGDLQDKVLRLYDPATATLSHLPYAVDLYREDYRLDGDYLAIPVVEADQGQDLNGDGDMADEVLHVHDLVLGTTTNFGLHATHLMLEDGLLLFRTTELSQGEDLNGDGDAVDPILYLANLSPTPPTPAELVEEIAAGIVSLDLQSGLSNSLATKIDGAFKLLGADVGNEVSIAGKLNALIHEVEAQRDKKISAEDADSLIADLEEVLSLLEPL